MSYNDPMDILFNITSLSPVCRLLSVSWSKFHFHERRDRRDKTFECEPV